jgi:hypothetical protein
MWPLTCQQGLRVVARNDKSMQQLGRKNGKQGVQAGTGAEGAHEARKVKGAQDIIFAPYTDICRFGHREMNRRKKLSRGCFCWSYVDRVGRV